ncbi:hypothetical protein [Paraburkholderia sp. CI3]|uniref:hypothetical protein n=1 Tax=Paraburkholderia sp. CI3 TaxID=2991060 RepID=UPI003D1AA932
MAELFRYIQQAFVVPAATDAINVARESGLQQLLTRALADQAPPERLRSIAGEFLQGKFSSPVADPFQLGPALRKLRTALLAPPNPDQSSIESAVQQAFGSPAAALAASGPFQSDTGLLDDTLVCVKLVSGFDRVNANDLLQMRRAAAYVADLAAGRVTDFSAKGIRAAFSRPVRIPQALVDGLKPSPDPNPPPAQTTPADGGNAALLTEQRSLQTAYETLMGLSPLELRMVPVPVSGPTTQQAATAPPAGPASEPPGHAPVARENGAFTGHANAAVPAALVVSPAALDRLGPDVLRVLSQASIDPATAPVPDVVAAIRLRWRDVSRQLAPVQIPAPVPVFRVGAHLFAIQPTTAPSSLPMLAGPPQPAPRPPIIRPIGVGDLLVVRQQLIGYEAGEVSHIENVLEGELLRRSTRREEVNELTITDETDTSQVDERDQQSTTRNDLSSEAQKEASQQTTSVQDQTTSTDYGKLVENSKTSYAKSVTDRAVNTVTQMVKQQRVQRERKTFTEEAMHELDNRKGNAKVRGIYQWVDKRYNTGIYNYGKRLLYDVVVPEPASFLLDALKNAVQPESFQLTKPPDFTLEPWGLNASNYQDYATLYGVTGSVSPPPDDFLQTVSYQEAKDVTGTVAAFGGNFFRVYYNAFQIPIPDTYKAVSGYIQRTNVAVSAPGTDRILEFFIGENTFIRYSLNDALNVGFAMNGETGVVPVTMNSLLNVIQLNYAIGIKCQRTDKAYEQWQLKTHATITSGYQRQLAAFQDKLASYQAAVRRQMALAQNFAHDPSIEEEELKKAFLFLILGEHFWQAYHLTPNPEAIPPDPTAVRDWGAMVAFFERAFEWPNIMYTYYPYFWGRPGRWGDLILIQDADPQFEAFLKAGAARVVVPVRPGFEAALAHFQETGDVWMGEEMPDMFSDYYVSIIEEIKARNDAPGDQVLVEEWEVKLPTTLVMLKDDAVLPEWLPAPPPNP